MSRPKVVTPEVTKLFREEAMRRVENLTNKQIAKKLAARGVILSPQYIGKLVTIEIESYKAKRSRRVITARETDSGKSLSTMGE